MHNVGYWLLVVKATLVKELKIQKRYVGWLLASLIQPIIWMILFSLIGRGFGIGNTSAGFDFTSFLILGVLLLMILSQSLWGAGIALRNEQYRGTLESTLTAPTHLTAMLVGYALVDLVLAGYLMVIGFTLGTLVFGLELTVVDPVGLLIAFAVTIYGVSGFAFMFAAVTLVVKQSNAIVNTVQPILFILTGIFFPLAALPPNVQQFSLLLPLTQGFLAIQDMTLNGATFLTVSPLLLGTIISGTVLAIIGILSLRATMKWSRHRGLLGAF
ncbi:MAG: ABC transporter permease [Candidatus Thorarchaeota archaeon]|nr:ABC transporter permease [Candidatus Thorarchaeota archaeon]